MLRNSTNKRQKKQKDLLKSQSTLSTFMSKDASNISSKVNESDNVSNSGGDNNTNISNNNENATSSSESNNYHQQTVVLSNLNKNNNDNEDADVDTFLDSCTIMNYNNINNFEYNENDNQYKEADNNDNNDQSYNNEVDTNPMSSLMMHIVKHLKVVFQQQNQGDIFLPTLRALLIQQL